MASLDLGNLCECGCGGFVKCSGSKFMRGHYIRTKKTRQKNRKSQMGYIHSENAKRKIGLASLGRKRTKESIRKGIKSRRQNTKRRGYYHSKEAIAKIRKSALKWERTEEYCQKMAKIKKNSKHSLETKIKMSKSHEGRIFSEEHKKNIGKAKKGITKEMNPNLTVPLHRRNSASQRMEECWNNPEFREERLKAIFTGRDMRPTKPERKLRKLLNRLFPNEYKYVGDGDVWIGGKCPDFINVNGQKKIIEMFGDYWHSKKVTGLSKKEHKKRRQSHFAKYGYQSLIVWQKQLLDKDKLQKKLILFHNEGV